MGAQPKRRLTRSRRHARRSRIHVAFRTLGRCPTCRSLFATHSVCPVCGNYRGEVVEETSETAAKYR